MTPLPNPLPQADKSITAATPGFAPRRGERELSPINWATTMGRNGRLKPSATKKQDPSWGQDGSTIGSGLQESSVGMETNREQRANIRKT